MEKIDSNINRRHFIKLSGITGAGLIVGLSLKGSNGISEVANLSGETASYELTPYVVIEKSGAITIFNTKPEIGQGVFQSIPALIAEELELSLDQVTIKQTGGQKQFGPMQFAGGSMSVRSSYTELRKVGASAKEMLLTAAGKRWNVPVEECKAESGKILHAGSGKSATYGELAEAASKLEVPKEPKLKDPKDFKLLGKNTQRPDIPLKSSGKAIFGIDVSVPNMVYASLAHCPVFGAKLISFDATASKKVKGVTRVETCVRRLEIAA